MFNKKDKAVTHSNLSPWVLVVIIVLFTALFFRNSGLYPLVIDEYYYNQFSRLTSFSAAYYPNYLYYAIYRSTLLCGDNFLSCVQFLNCGLYVAAFFPIYRIAQTVCVPKIAIWVSLLALLAPFNYFTAFFMTEAPFFLVFWALIWTILCINFAKKTQFWKWAIVGIALGIAGLIKVNALLITPAILIYLFYECFLVNKCGRKGLLINIAVFLAFILITKLGLSFILVGRAGLSFGGIYTGALLHVTDVLISTNSLVSNATSSPSIWFYLEQKLLIIGELIHILAFNFMPICFIFGVAIANIFAFFMSKRMQAIDSVEKQNFYCLCFFLIINLLLLTSAFTWVAIHFGGEKLHTMRRYYEFAFPLFFIAIAAQLPHTVEIQSKFKIGIFLVVAIFTGIAIHGVLGGLYWYIDWFSPNDLVFYGWICLMMLALVLWLYRAQLGNYFYLFCVLPLIISFANYGIFQSLQQSRIAASDLDKAGLFVRQHLSKEEISKLAIGSNKPNLMSLFYFDNPEVAIQKLPENGQFELPSLPKGKDWILLLGSYSLADEAFNSTHMDYLPLGYATLFGGHGFLDLDLSKGDWPGIIEKQIGLSDSPERWGTWSIKDKVILQFTKPLPRKFNLVIDARAFGPNVGKEFQVRLGQNLDSFTLGSNFEKKIIPIFNPQKLNTLEIEIPKPTSPLDLGQGSDARKLGIGLAKIQIQW